MKINVDVGFLHNKCTYAIIARDAIGEFVETETGNGVYCSSTEAEAIAILKALQLVCQEHIRR